ncbi:MAG: flavin reductase family protein [Pseudolabrys sp.]|nr:flavin reductase family protein [Pseudolabrys sp.]
MSAAGQKIGQDIMQEPVVFDRRSFRDALAAFATGVTVISTVRDNGERIGITANSFGSVSLDPPLVLFSIAKRAHSLAGFLHAPRFAVSVLASDQGAVSNRFAVSSGEKWDGTDYSTAENGCPIINGALASFECDRHAHHEAGDHVILIGLVRRFERLATGEPLMFFRGSYRALAPNAEFPDYAGNEPKVLPPLNGFDPWTSG